MNHNANQKYDIHRKYVTLLKMTSSSSSSSSSKNSDSFLETIQEVGLLPTLLKQNPIELRGVITLPFGTFEILYLDEELRIIKTGQNYLAVNVRQKGTEEWF
uniref:Plastid lipid-associated protein/fibrillin conserved domain-containing protein n=1 Tax=Ditylum brightwellii TaxID=49249 RepID=A0A7S1Z0U5_9STRA|mmetsp:Transcript_21630/g.32176  ORF Transcript_21630/g.32176 Transcript_21630/m.32176 type:complete len:102 (+) Transcript_21630:488-793(+)